MRGEAAGLPDLKALAKTDKGRAVGDQSMLGQIRRQDDAPLGVEGQPLRGGEHQSREIFVLVGEFLESFEARAQLLHPIDAVAVDRPVSV